MSKNIKKYLIICLIVLILVVSIILFIKFNDKPSEKVTEEVKEVDVIQTKEFDYVLYDNKSTLYHEYFKQLKDMLLSENIDDLEYAKIISELFVIDFYSLEDKKTNTVDVKLFDTVTVKELEVSIIDETTVIPIGQVSGLKLYTNGVLVVGKSEIRGEDNQKYKPYENSGIEEGDRIVKINNNEVADTENLIELVNNSKGENIEIEYIKNNEVCKCNLNPVKTADGTYKLGLWVRDSAAGIGTLTFYEPSTGNFAALGHGITDSDTGVLVEISNGEFLTTKIISIIKGLKGSPRKNSRNN